MILGLLNSYGKFGIRQVRLYIYLYICAHISETNWFKYVVSILNINWMELIMNYVDGLGLPLEQIFPFPS